MIWFLVSNAAKFLLILMGWSLLDDNIFAMVNKHDRAVLVFSHTSYIDFCILVLYLFAYPDKLSHIRTLVKPQPFRYAGWILRTFGAIPATKVDDKQGGAIPRIIGELQSQKKWFFLISPKGSILKREWRSGYYIIANNFNVPIMVTGADYEKKCMILFDSTELDKTEEDARIRLQSELSQIVPLFPEEEVVKIRRHDASKRNLVNPVRLIIGLSIISLLVYALI